MKSQQEKHGRLPTELEDIIANFKSKKTNLPIHDHCCHSSSSSMRNSRTCSIAVRCVSIRLLVIETSSKVLNRHQFLLAVVLNVEIQDVIGKVVDSSRQGGNLVSTRLRFPIHLDSRLHRLAVFRNVASAFAIGDARLGQGERRRWPNGVLPQPPWRRILQWK